MDKKIRVGIIGTGFGAKVHAPLMNIHPGFEVVSLASVSRGNIEDVEKFTGIHNIYNDWEKMIENEELDLVSVTSAPFLHKEMVVKVFEKNFHVIAEKPMALNIEEAKAMIEARERANRMGFINFEFRFLPARLKVKEIMDSKKLGRILHINYKGTYQGYYRNLKRKYWLGDKEKGGGMLGALGSHMIDSMMWWKNEEIESVYGQLPIHFPEFTDENGEKEIRTAEDSFQVMGDFRDGTTFNIDFIFGNRNTSSWKLEVHGTNGTLMMTNDNKVELALEDNSLEEVSIPTILQPTADLPDYTKRYYGQFYPMLDHLYQGIAENNINPYLATFEDGFKVQAVMDAIKKSAEEKRRIVVTEKQ